jgi:hypothetical protein
MMKKINYKKIGATLLIICAVIFGLTMLTNAAVKPDLISKAPNGDNGNATTRNYSVSADGRYVVFDSDATNLVSGLTDTNNGPDIFLRDTQTGTLRCISLSSSGGTGNSFSINPIISADGHYVVFASNATDLVGGFDLNNDLDVFRFNTQTNQKELVSVNAIGSSTGNSYSGNTLGGWHTYDMSDDGRYVAFMSNASDLSLTADSNNKSDIFIRDMQLGGTRLVSINKTGSATGNNGSFNPSISADGQKVVFTSLASDLITTDGNVNYDVFIYNYQTQVTKCASSIVLNPDVSSSSFSSTGVISKDGTRVAYYSQSTDLTNLNIPFQGPTQVYVYDLGLGINTLASINAAGNAEANSVVGIGNTEQLNVSISSNGRYVTFETRASNLVSTAPGPAYNVFRRDLLEGKTEVVSLKASGTQASTGNAFNGLRGGGMSRDGRFVTFSSAAFDLVSDFPISNGEEVYVRDMLNGITTAMTLNYAGTAVANNFNDAPLISANGKSVVFISSATDLTATHANNGFFDLYKAVVPTPQRAVADFDGDGLSDFAVFRPSLNGVWYVLNNSATNASYRYYGAGSDLLAPADYNGDGRTDYAIFRPSNGTWYISDSLTFSESSYQFGLSGDKPLPEDFDGDGKADLAVYRGGTWWWQSSHTGQFTSYQFGLANDIPVQGDFDGDGRADYAVFRPSNGTWYVQKSSNGGVMIVNFGLSGDKPVAADFDGDGRTDIAVFRSGIWYILQSRDSSVITSQFGLATDIPSVGSYDGDGKADIAVFRPSDGNWYVLRSSNNAFSAVNFGQNGDTPVPAAFIP